MNKAQLIDRIAKETRLSKTSIEKTLNSAFTIIKDSVVEGDNVTLLGFGTFTISTRKERQGHNPHTGKKMTIPEITMPRFKPSKDFKDLLQ